MLALVWEGSQEKGNPKPLASFLCRRVELQLAYPESPIPTQEYPPRLYYIYIYIYIYCIYIYIYIYIEIDSPSIA